MAVRTDPSTARQKWATRLSGATQEITQGVQRVQRAPGQAAAAKQQKWLQGVTNSADKWARNVAAVSLGDWQNAMTQIGIPRISSGVQAKGQKWENFANQFFPHLEAGLRTVESMPDNTFEDRMARMVAMARHNHNFRRSGQ